MPSGVCLDSGLVDGPIKVVLPDLAGVALVVGKDDARRILEDQRVCCQGDVVGCL